MEKSPIGLLKRVGRANSLSSLQPQSIVKIEHETPAKIRKRSKSEPWMNTWDSDVWIRDKRLEGDPINHQSPLSFNLFRKKEIAPISKEDAIKQLKTERPKTIKRRASIVGMVEQPVKKIVSKEKHLKRLSMNPDRVKRRSRLVKPKTQANLKYNLKHVDAIINFVIDRQDQSQLLEGLAIIEGTVVPQYNILEAILKVLRDIGSNHKADKKYDNIRTALINYIGKRMTLLPIQFASDDDSVLLLKSFLKEMEQSSDPLDVYFYDSLQKAFEKVMAFKNYEEETIPISLILELAKTNNIKSLESILDSNSTELCRPILGKKLIAHLSMQHKAKDSVNVLYISPMEIARQWTLLDHELISKISIDDIIQNVRTPNRSVVLSEVADRFNHSTSWIASQILRVDNSRKRSVVIAHLIEVANHLLELQNYQGFISFMMGLEQVPVSRLASTWKKVPSKSLKTFHKLQKIAYPTNNFSELRKLSENIKPPLVPAPSMFLKDMLVFLEMNNSNFIEQNIVKTDLISICHKILVPVVHSQATTFPFYKIPIIQSFLESGMILEFEELEAMSRRLEPGKEL